jgi:MFS family permease
MLPLLFLINSSPSFSTGYNSNSSITSVEVHQISYVVAALIAGIGNGATGPVVKATLTNITFPTSCGTAFALLNTFDDFGRGLGPLFAVILIQLFHGDRQRAFNVGNLGWLLCGLFNLASFLVAKTDK